MRLSVLEDDPGFSGDAVHHAAFLDGEQVDLAVTADEELGLVREWLRGPDGRPQLDGAGNRVLADRYGRVELRRLPG